MGAGHQIPGRVSSIGEHYGSKSHASISVTHGKRKRSKGPDGTKGELSDHSQPNSTVVVPKAVAKNYTMGQKVNVGISPADDDDDADMENDNDADDAPAKSSTKGKGAPPGKNAKPMKKAMRQASPIAQAIVPPRSKR